MPEVNDGQFEHFRFRVSRACVAEQVLTLLADKIAAIPPMPKHGLVTSKTAMNGLDGRHLALVRPLTGLLERVSMEASALVQTQGHSLVLLSPSGMHFSTFHVILGFQALKCLS